MKKITGMMVYYYNVCKRKLWFFSNEINMEDCSEDVKIGALLDQKSYGREDKHINIDNVINKYYLYYLKQRGVVITAKIDYPLLKKNVYVELTDEDEINIEAMLQDIESITDSDTAPDKLQSGICKKCAYYDLCYI